MLKMTTEKLKVLVRLKGRVMFFKTLALKKLVVLALYASDLQYIKRQESLKGGR